MGTVLEIDLLRRYRRDLEDTRQQSKKLNARVQALLAAITGLEAMLRLHGVDPDQIEEGEARPTGRKEAAKSTTAAVAGDGIMAAVMAVIRDSSSDLGAKDVQRRLQKRGVIIAYHTLYRILIRDAASAGGVLVRHGDGFALRETNGGG